MNKTQLILTALAVILGLAACTETQKESSEEAKQEVTTQLQKVIFQDTKELSTKDWSSHPKASLHK